MDKDTFNTTQDKFKQIQKNTEKPVGFVAIDDKDILYKRTQKIVTAIYIVTNFIPDNDLLRGQLRDHSLKLLSLIGSIVFDTHSNLGKLIYEINFTSNQIVSMLGIAYYAGYISEMNHRILVKELEFYTDESGQFRSELENKFMLRESGLAVSTVPRDLKDKNREPTSREDGQSRVKSSFLIKDKTSSPVFVKKQSRKDAIISILSKKGDVTIKDISNVISNCSEKTIQRELISLVKNGVLKKSGERRWSKYSLV